MQVSESYDLIVIGNQLGGYFLASAAAQKGRRVLVIDQKAKESALFERPTGNFLTDLYWEPVIGLAQGNSVDVFLRSIGVYQDVQEIFPECSPPLQVVMPQGRVNFHYPFQNLPEWSREFPRAASGLNELSLKLKNPSAHSHRPFSQVVEQAGLDMEWSQLGEVQAPLYGSLSPENIPLSLLQFYLAEAASGVRYSIGGKDSLKEILSARLKSFGGKVKRDAYVEEIVFEKGRLEGALLSSFEGFVRSSAVVGSMDSQRFLGLLPEKYQPDALVREVNALEPRFWRLSFSIRVPEEIVPEGMGNHVCYNEGYGDLSEGQLLQVFVLPRGSYSGIPAGQKVLLVRALMPFAEKSLRPSHIAITIKRCLQQIQGFIPFLDAAGCTVVPNPHNLENDWVFKNHLNFSSLHDIPTDLLVYGKISDTKCIKGVESNWSRYGLPGLGLCSRDVAPSAGILGEMKTAMLLLQDVLAIA